MGSNENGMMLVREKQCERRNESHCCHARGGEDSRLQQVHSCQGLLCWLVEVHSLKSYAAGLQIPHLTNICAIPVCSKNIWYGKSRTVGLERVCLSFYPSSPKKLNNPVIFPGKVITNQDKEKDRIS
jgi:hypothetical protein